MRIKNKNKLSDFEAMLRIMEVLATNTLFQRLFHTHVAEVKQIIAESWVEPHRYYHGVQHLYDLMVPRRFSDKESNELWEVIACFHDIVYDPCSLKTGANEQASLNMFYSLLCKDAAESMDDIKTVILDTATGKGSTIFSSKFQEANRKYLSASKQAWEVAEIEHNLFKEYQFVDYSIYRKERVKFLESQRYSNGNRMCDCGHWQRNNDDVLDDHINFVNAWVPSIGIYAGSFDPFHIGHMNILQKAEKMFDKVIVAIGTNPDKAPSEQTSRLIDVRKLLPYHQVEFIPGMLTEYITEKMGMDGSVASSHADITLIRGLRNGFDFNYEQTQLRFMEDMCPLLKVAYIPCDRAFEYISSSGIRAINKINKSEAERYKP